MHEWEGELAFVEVFAEAFLGGVLRFVLAWGTGRREGEKERKEVGREAYLTRTEILIIVADLKVDAYLSDEIIDEGADFLRHVLAH